MLARLERNDAAASQLREWVRQELPGFLTRGTDQALFVGLIGHDLARMPGRFWRTHPNLSRRNQGNRTKKVAGSSGCRIAECICCPSTDAYLAAMDHRILSIEQAFAILDDPRSRTPVYDLTDMLMVTLCAILCGADDRVAIQTWGEGKPEWLRRHIPLAHGVPSHDTFGRVFAALDPRQFEACFIRWMRGLCPALGDQVVAIDGRTVRGSRRRDQRAIHLVAACAGSQAWRWDRCAPHRKAMK